MRTIRLLTVAVAGVVAAASGACKDAPDSAMVERRSDGVLIASRDSLLKTPGYVVDSILPVTEGLRRVQVAIGGGAVTRLDLGATSRDSVLVGFWSALTADTSIDAAMLNALVLTPREWAFVYLPSSPEVAAGMQPVAAHQLYEMSSSRGLSRASERLRAVHARGARATGVVCADAHETAAFRLWSDCGLVVRDKVQVDTIALRASIIGKNGVYKLVSFANAL